MQMWGKGLVSFGMKSSKERRIALHLVKGTLKKWLKRSKSGFILLESIVAIGLLAVCLGVYQVNQMDLVVASRKEYQEVQMLRVLAEEVRGRQMTNESSGQYEVTRQERFIITYEAEPFHQAMIQTGGLKWAVYRED